MLTVKKILMNYSQNLVGIDKMPQIGWILESELRDVKQKSYQIQIARENSFADICYDTGKVLSEESAHIIINDICLESGFRYYIRVRVTDYNNESSDWSQNHSFVTSVVDKSQWKAKFISAETIEAASLSKSTYVRTGFSVKGNVAQAYIFSTALGLYQLYLNGDKVGDDELAPGWTSYHKHLMYQTYDVTDMLHKGQNVVGAMLGAGWYKGKMGFTGDRNHYGKQTAFFMQMLIRYEDGSIEWVYTDDKWQGCDAPVVFSEIYDGELYDARLEINEWCKSFGKEGNWKGIHVVDFPLDAFSSQSDSRIVKTDERKVVKLFTTPQGDTVLDFGQNLTGWIHISCKGKADHKIQLQCFEVLDVNGNVYLDNLRSAKQTMTYLCKDDDQISYHPHFTFMGFRYAKIIRFPGEAKAEYFTAWVIHSKMEPTGSFSCSNQDVNQLWHNIIWGMKGNFLDVPTDCPQRNERLGWTGDAQIFCRTASFIMNTYAFFSKWLKDVEADQTPEGGVPHVVPDIVTGLEKDDWLLSQGTHSAAAWADVAVINPWMLYLTFGDKQILKEQYSSMKAWVTFMKNHAVDYIWNYKLQFGDWVALDAEEGSYFGATPNDLTCTAYYAYSTLLFSKIAKILEQEEDHIAFGELHEKIKDKFQKTFFDKNGNMTAKTQTAHIIALYFSLVPEKYREKTVEGLLQLLKKENGHLVTGFVGTPYFCHALSQNGHAKEAYELLLKDDFPSWLYQVKMGATTIWEHWDGIKPDGTMWSPDMNSFNHYAYGAIGEWLVRVVGGLEIDEIQPGYLHSIIAPMPGGGLTHAKASYESVYGTVSSDWNILGNTVTMNFKIPHNTIADICLQNVHKMIEQDGLNFMPREGSILAQAGSGSYKIIYTI